MEYHEAYFAAEAWAGRLLAKLLSLGVPAGAAHLNKVTNHFGKLTQLPKAALGVSKADPYSLPSRILNSLNSTAQTPDSTPCRFLSHASSIHGLGKAAVRHLSGPTEETQAVDVGAGGKGYGGRFFFVRTLKVLDLRESLANLAAKY